MKSIEEHKTKRYTCSAGACSMEEGTYHNKECEFVTSKDYDEAIKTISKVQYTEDEIKEKCKYSLAVTTLENRDQYYLGFRSAFIALGALKGNS